MGLVPPPLAGRRLNLGSAPSAWLLLWVFTLAVYMCVAGNWHISSPSMPPSPPWATPPPSTTGRYVFTTLLIGTFAVVADDVQKTLFAAFGNPILWSVTPPSGPGLLSHPHYPGSCA
jgi:hypothetical protein